MRPIPASRSLLLPSLLLAVALSACDFGEVLTVQPEFDHTFSFEDGLEEWYAEGTDLQDPPVDWRVELSSESASEGSRSVLLHLANLNDAGKIWIERPYAVAPDQLYEVVVAFDFATADHGDVNLWRILAGAAPEPPAQSGALSAPGDTGAGEDADAGHVWTERSFKVQARSDEDGELFVFVGVWGTSEFERSYWIDRLRVALTRVGPTLD